MINLFQIAANDKSMDYLSRVFGNVNGIININGTPLGDSVTVLGTMFKTFNSLVLAVAVLILVYVTVIGVLATAHEGEFMGKKWNNIWIPLRVVVGVGMLVPTGSGYCGLQLLIMWVIVQGIGAADMVWNTALNYTQTHGGIYQQNSQTLPNAGVTTQLNGLFQGLACDATFKMKAADPSNPANTGAGSYYCHVKNDAWCGSTITLNPNATKLALGPGGACGTLTYCDQSATGACSDPNSLSCLSCKQQINILQQIIPTLSGMAQQLAAADYSYRDFYANSATQANGGNWQWIYSYCSSQNPAIPKNQCCVGSTSPNSTCKSTSAPAALYSPNDGTNPQNPSGNAVSNIYWPFWQQFSPSLGSTDFIQTNANYYMSAANQALTTYLASQNNPNSLGPIFATASANGWVLAGSFYYTIADMNSKNFSMALPTLNWSGGDVSKEPLLTYRNNVSAASALESAAASTGAAQYTATSSPQLSGVNSLVNDTLNGISSGFSNLVTGGGGNPLIALEMFGSIMILTAEILFGVIVGLLIAFGIAGNIDIFFLGSGAVDPVGPALSIVLMFLVPGVYAVIGLLISLGGLLAVYTPLIPYVVFTFGAIGWLILVVEAMVAGPLVALQVLAPSEHHGPLGRAETALILLFNVFLRPSLMIFGLIAAMLLATVVIFMINAGFAVVLVNFMTPPLDPVKFIMLIAAYVMLVLAALNKCFSAINVIPAQVMRWIGGHGEGDSAQEALAQVKGGVETAGAKAGGALVSAGGTTKEAVTAAKAAKTGEDKGGGRLS